MDFDQMNNQNPVTPETPVQNTDSFGYPNPTPTQPVMQGNVNPYSNPNMNGNYNPNMNYNYNLNDNKEEPLSVGEWFVTLLLLSIPCVNIIMLFVYAFGSGNKSRANYAKATLIWAGIALVLYIIFFVICIAAGISFAEVIGSAY